MPRLDGPDCAHYQVDVGPVDWATLDANSWWIAWKATQSTRYVDPTFAEARLQSSQRGFEQRGWYHWLSSSTDVVAQAAHYLATIGPLQVGEFAMLDAEEAGISVPGCLTWCESVEAITHRPVVIYSGLYVSGGTIWKSVELRHSRYGPRPFIVAAYVTEANLIARMVATGALPDYPRQAWQWSSNGPVPGIIGRCDMDQIDDVAAFELAAGIIHTPIPHPPIGDDMAITIFELTDDPAIFLAYTSQPSGAAIECRWCWDVAALTYHRNAGALVQRFNKSVLRNISLNGVLPPGFTAADFANTADPSAVDQSARDQAANANAAVARVGQDLGDVKMNLARAGTVA